MPFRIPTARINWTNSSFLIGTAIITLTAVPVYLWFYGVDAFQLSLFFAFFIATGLSITLGYHRLFAHVAFQASWPVRLVTLIFGAAAFENTALMWVSDHRRHH
ncbi:MAG TPA: acyl-CoA desaturase, partial [Opitutus sp.]|nr:acyl-CoA desaturase [Opitutus sp.]